MNLFKKAYYRAVSSVLNAQFLRSSPVETLWDGKKSGSLLLLTVAFNNPRVLALHLGLCKRFICDDYVHVVLDNSPLPEMRHKNSRICCAHGASWVSLPPNPWTGVHNSRSHGICLNWAMQHVVPRYFYDVLGVLDHDVFPVRPHALQNEMYGSEMMGLHQARPGIWYLWPGFAFFTKGIIDTVPMNFLPTRFTDTGGALWKKLYAQFPRNKVVLLEEQQKRLRQGVERQDAFYYTFGHWIHTVNASYWKECAPKEDHIATILQKETGCTDLDEFSE